MMSGGTSCQENSFAIAPLPSSLFCPFVFLPDFSNNLVAFSFSHLSLSPFFSFYFSLLSVSFFFLKERGTPEI